MVDNAGPDPHSLIPSLALLPLTAVLPLEAGAETIVCVDTMTLWVAKVPGPALTCSHSTDHGIATTGPSCAAGTQGFLRACGVITEARFTP